MPLSFVQSTPGAPFVVFFCAGLTLLGAFYLLRPWPPRRGRVLALVALVAVCVVAGLNVAQQHTVWIDSGHRVVQRQSGVPGLQRVRNWSFAQIQAVVVSLRPENDFELGLDTPDGWLPLQTYPEVQAAERQARELAALADWTALRRDYRLAVRAQGGEAQNLESPSGRRILSVELNPLRQVVPAPEKDEPMH